MKADPSEVQKSLRDVSYPTDRERLLQAAARNGADDEIVGVLRELPEAEFEGPDDVMKALGEQS